MVKIYQGIESKPSLVTLNNIEVTQEKSNLRKGEIDKIVQSLKDHGYNLFLPVVCLTEEEDKYHLLTGLPIYEAAKVAELERIWVFLIAQKQSEAQKIVGDSLSQSKFNEAVVEPLDIQAFLVFINNSDSELTAISGIGNKYAQLIASHRPYETPEQMQKALGAKRSLKWVQSYKMMENRP